MIPLAMPYKKMKRVGILCSLIQFLLFGLPTIEELNWRSSMRQSRAPGR